MTKLKLTKKKAKSTDTSAIFIFGFVMLWGVFTVPEVFIVPFIISLFVVCFLLYVKFKKHNALRKSNIEQIDFMNGVQFEEYLTELFKTLGYRVKNTPRSGDYGADLILRKNRRTIAVQAKRYKGCVGISAVQEIIGAQKYYNADDIWVITNSYYSKSAINLASVNNVRLIDREGLIKLSHRLLK